MRPLTDGESRYRAPHTDAAGNRYFRSCIENTKTKVRRYEIPDKIVDGQVQEPWTDPVDLSTNNQTFGRRFKILSFRWLQSNDV